LPYGNKHRELARGQVGLGGFGREQHLGALPGAVEEMQRRGVQGTCAMVLFH
jgi:hypothetical protein